MGGSNSTDKAGTTRPVASPCINICALDHDDICTGCYRSVQEIAGWGRMDDEQKRSVLRRSVERARERGRLL